jgi:hypothetical protein
MIFPLKEDISFFIWFENNTHLESFKKKIFKNPILFESFKLYLENRREIKKKTSFSLIESKKFEIKTNFDKNKNPQKLPSSWQSKSNNFSCMIEKVVEIF